MIMQIDHCEHVVRGDKHIKANYLRYLFPELSGQAWHGIFECIPFLPGEIWMQWKENLICFLLFSVVPL